MIFIVRSIKVVYHSSFNCAVTVVNSNIRATGPYAESPSCIIRISQLVRADAFSCTEPAQRSAFHLPTGTRSASILHLQPTDQEGQTGSIFLFSFVVLRLWHKLLANVGK